MTITRTTPPQTGLHEPQTGLYDSRRDIYYPKPAWRGWLHLLWFEAALVLGTLLLATSHGTKTLVAVAIYTASVVGLFGTSALYHRGNWSPCWSSRLQRLDHTMIFILIAGTATPAFLLATPGTFGLVGLIVTWSLTAVALLLHLVWMDAPEKLVGATFIGLGVVASMALPSVWTSKGVAPFLLLLIGGLLYAAGAISYHQRRPDPCPSVFGYHEVFHSFVCVAAACQYVAIGVYIA